MIPRRKPLLARLRTSQGPRCSSVPSRGARPCPHHGFAPLSLLAFGAAVVLLLGTPSASAQPWGAWLPGPGAYGDWHWRPPVPDEASLPSGDPEGSVRVSLAEAAPYCYVSGVWQPCGGGGAVVTDHGALTGLSDDDHPQYVLDAGDSMSGDLVMPSGLGSPSIYFDGYPQGGIGGQNGYVYFYARNADQSTKRVFDVQAQGLQGGTGSYWRIWTLDATATVPVFTPEGVFDFDTGLGHAAQGDLRLIADSVSAVGITPGAVTDYVPRVAAPVLATCQDSGDSSPGALVITPTTSSVQVTNSDANGCSVTLSETAASSGQTLRLWVVSTAGGTVGLADAPGLQETGTGCSMGLYGAADLDYLGDRWALASCRPSN